MRRVEMIMTSPVVPALRRPRRALWLAFITDQREVGREMGTTARIVFCYTVFYGNRRVRGERVLPNNPARGAAFYYVFCDSSNMPKLERDFLLRSFHAQ